MSELEDGFAQKSRILVCGGHWDVISTYVGQLNMILDEHIPTGCTASES
jgi:hypothetical protein